MRNVQAGAAWLVVMALTVGQAAAEPPSGHEAPGAAGLRAGLEFGSLTIEPDWGLAPASPGTRSQARKPKSDSLANGALIGLAAGLATTAATTYYLCGLDDRECTVVAGYTLGAGIVPASVAIGALVDWMIRDQPAAVVWPEWQGERFSVGPVVRVDRVTVEGRTAAAPVAGLVFASRLRGPVGVEVELTEAGGFVERTGVTLYYAYRDGTAIPVPVRATTRWTPGLGGAAALTFRTPPGWRVGIAGRIGAGARRYTASRSFEAIELPAGVDATRFGSGQEIYDAHMRGGLFAGVEVPIRVTERLYLAPDFRVLWGGPGDIGQHQQELGLGLKASVRF
ncbi:MAG: hypothetical protein AB7O67_05480 [Vicinamibacterales bacterium]